MYLSNYKDFIFSNFIIQTNLKMTFNFFFFIFKFDFINKIY